MAIQGHDLVNISTPDAAIPVSGSDNSSPTAETNLRKRRAGRVDGLGHLGSSYFEVLSQS